ncbi:MAG: Ig-like domain-containing protein, partial [Gemmatimonadaceae bacterium]
MMRNSSHSTHLFSVVATRRRLMFWAVALLTLACSGSLTDVTPVGGTTVTSIAITPPSATLALGGQFPLQAVATDADGKVVASADIFWTIRDTAIASVSASGVVSARSVGSTQVAASANGHSAVAAITVAIPSVASVVV